MKKSLTFLVVLIASFLMMPFAQAGAKESAYASPSGVPRLSEVEQTNDTITDYDAALAALEDTIDANKVDLIGFSDTVQGSAFLTSSNVTNTGVFTWNPTSAFGAVANLVDSDFTTTLTPWGGTDIATVEHSLTVKYGVHPVPHKFQLYWVYNSVAASTAVNQANDTWYQLKLLRPTKVSIYGIKFGSSDRTLISSLSAEDKYEKSTDATLADGGAYGEQIFKITTPAITTTEDYASIQVVIDSTSTQAFPSLSGFGTSFSMSEFNFYPMATASDSLWTMYDYINMTRINESSYPVEKNYRHLEYIWKMMKYKAEYLNMDEAGKAQYAALNDTIASIFALGYNLGAEASEYKALSDKLDAVYAACSVNYNDTLAALASQISAATADADSTAVIDADSKLVTAGTQSGLYVSNNKLNGNGWPLGNLIDNDQTTMVYTLFNTDPVDEGPHYVSYDAGEGNTLPSKLAGWWQESTTANFQTIMAPTAVTVYASTDNSEWTKLTDLTPTYDANQEYTTPMLDLSAGYRSIKFAVTSTTGGSNFVTTDGNPAFEMGEFNLLNTKKVYNDSINSAVKSALTDLRTALDEANSKVEAGSATEDDVNSLKDAYNTYLNAVDMASRDTAALHNIFVKASNYAENATASDAPFYNSEEEIETLNAAVQNVASARPFINNKQDVIDSLASYLTAAYDTALASVNVPDSTKWYTIFCADTAAVDGNGVSMTNQIAWIGGVHDYDGFACLGSDDSYMMTEPRRAWRFQATDNAGFYNLINCGSGWRVNKESVLVKPLGNGQIGIAIGGGSSYYVINSAVLPGVPAGSITPARDAAGAWGVKEAPEALTYTKSLAAGSLNAIVLPFETDTLPTAASGEDSVAVYSIASLKYGRDGNTVTGVNLSKFDGSSIPAGTPFVVSVPGTNDVTVDFHAKVNGNVTNVSSVANGLIGTFSDIKVIPNSAVTFVDGNAEVNADTLSVAPQNAYVAIDSVSGSEAGDLTVLVPNAYTDTLSALADEISAATAMVDSSLVADSSSMIINTGNQAGLYVSNNKVNGNGYPLGNLIDNDQSTFVLTLFNGSAPVDTGYHYVRYDAGEGNTLPSYLAVYWQLSTTANFNTVAAPTAVTIYAGQNDSTWEKITSLEPSYVDNAYTTPVLDLSKGYRAIKVEVTNNITNGAWCTTDGKPTFEMGEFNLLNTKNVYNDSLKPAVKSALDELRTAIAKADTAVNANDANQADVDSLKAAYQRYLDAVDMASRDTAALHDIFVKASGYAENAIASDAPFYNSDEEIEALNAAVQNVASARPFINNKQDVIDSLTSYLTAAYDTALASINMPDSTKWYTIFCADTAAVDGNGVSMTNQIAWIGGVHDYDGFACLGSDDSYMMTDPRRAWRFQATDTAGFYNLINCGSGWRVHQEPVLVKPLGNGQIGIAIGNGSIYYVINSAVLPGVPAGPITPARDAAGAWGVKEAPEALTYTKSFAQGSVSAMVLPFDTYALPVGTNGEDVKAYEVLGYNTIDGNKVSVKLKEITTEGIAAGTPFVLAVEQGSGYDASNSVTVDFKAMVNGNVTNVADMVNGLAGTFAKDTLAAGSVIYFDKDSAYINENAALYYEPQQAYILLDSISDNEGEPDLVLVINGNEELVGIQNAAVSDADTLVNVYTIDGVLVKKNVKKSEAAEGLSKGIYIIGNKKQYVK